MDSNKTSHEATEVLAAARGALQIQRKGMGVWSNWDLVVCPGSVELGLTIR